MTEMIHTRPGNGGVDLDTAEEDLGVALGQFVRHGAITVTQAHGVIALIVGVPDDKAEATTWLNETVEQGRPARY